MTEEKSGPTIVVVGTGAANMRALGGNDAAPVKHPVTTAPTLQGPHGRAWLCNLAVGRSRLNIPAEQDGTVAHWVVEAPWAHPAWHSYSIVLMHLRPLPRGGQTLLYRDGATHEMWVKAMDPSADYNDMIASGIVTNQWLSPSNFAAQFIEITDELALERVRKTVQEICDGRLSPDTDFRSDWIHRFGDNMMKDRQNYRPPVVRPGTNQS